MARTATMTKSVARVQAVAMANHSAWPGGVRWATTPGSLVRQHCRVLSSANAASSLLHVAREGGVATLTLNDDKKRNALSTQVIQSMDTGSCVSRVLCCSSLFDSKNFSGLIDDDDHPQHCRRL